MVLSLLGLALVACVVVPVAFGASGIRNGRIVFVADRLNGTSGIVSIKSNGTGRRNLTHRSDFGPALSANGRMVAFTRYLASTAAVYVMNADGNNQRQVVAGSSPSWSPDLRHLVYMTPTNEVAVVDLVRKKSVFLLPAGWTNLSWAPNGAHIAALNGQNLVVMRPDSTDQKILDNGATSFSWSPDGRRIAFATSDGFLRVASVDTGQVETLVSGLDQANDALWSPNGKWIAYTAIRSANGLGVFLIASAGGNPRELAHGQERLLTWSPDSQSLALLYGNQIAVASVGAKRLRWLTHEARTSSINTGLAGPYASWAPNNTIFYQHIAGRDQELLTIDSDGNHERQLTHDDVPDSYPAWSPDGKYIAYSRQVGNSANHSEVFVMGGDGLNVRRVTKAPSGVTRLDADPAWSPDGKRIAFTSSQSGGAISIVNADGTHQHVVVHIDASDLAWSPNGRELAYSLIDPSTANSDDLLGRLVVTMPASGNGDQRTVAQGTQPEWSPDGTHIVFVHVESCGDECDATSLHITSSNSTGERAIPGSDGLCEPHYSPDGRFIVAASSGAIVTLDPNRGVIRTIHVAGSGGQCTLQPDWQPLHPSSPSTTSSQSRLKTQSVLRGLLRGRTTVRGPVA